MQCTNQNERFVANCLKNNFAYFKVQQMEAGLLLEPPRGRSIFEEVAGFQVAAEASRREVRVRFKFVDLKKY